MASVAFFFVFWMRYIEEKGMLAKKRLRNTALDHQCLSTGCIVHPGA